MERVSAKKENCLQNMNNNLVDIPDDWQHEDILLALRHCKRFDLALDCGAHRGVTVNCLLTVFKKVVAFEPSNLADKIDDRAIVHKIALGKEFSCGSLAPGKHNTGQTHVVEGKDILIAPLDSFDLSPDFIKLDVEGMELEVLMGGKETILRSKPLIMFEENGLSLRRGVARGETGQYLESLGMRRLEVLKLHGSDEDWVYSF